MSRERGRTSAVGDQSVSRSPLLKAYVEPSAVNHAVDVGLAGRDLRGVLGERGAVPATSLHAVCELAATFLRPAQRPRAMALFAVLDELEPLYHPEPGELLDAEYHALRTGALVIPTPRGLDGFELRLEVARLARGDLRDRQRAFLSDLDAKLRVEQPKLYDGYLAYLERVAPRGSTLARKLRTFEDVMALGPAHGGELVREIMHCQISVAEGARWWRRLDEFPTMRTIVRANAFQSTPPIVARVRPARDRIHDSRHVIEAAYCDLFVTADEGQARAVSKLHPALRVIRFADLLPTSAIPGSRE